MKKYIVGFVVVFLTFFHLCVTGPVELEKSSDDDMKTSETFGYGYYQPGLYRQQQIAAPAPYQGAPLATVGAYPVAPLATKTSLVSSSSGNARSGYGYGSGYKYGGGFGYGSRWGYGSGGAANEFYRSHPVYVAWG